MESALDLEKRYANLPVRIAMRGIEGSGVLALAGKETSATLSISKWLTERDTETGWFDLMLQESNGRKILLHNALTTSTSMPNSEPRMWEHHIFPNMVIFDAQNILSGARVREFRFTAQGLGDIFNYDKVEWQSLYGAPPEIIKAIRDLRRHDRPYPRTYDTFAPTDIYVTHRLPRVLRIRVADRSYEIFIGSSMSHGSSSVRISTYPIATIRFDKPVSIDDALDAAWSWRRFFSQIAMKPLPFNTLTCRGKKGRLNPMSLLYLPNIARESADDDRGPFAFRPSHVPFGGWKHRAEFAEAMRQWLAKDEQRRLFRVRLDRVLEGMRKESSTGLVAELCSALESLSELKESTALKDSDIELLAEAAADAASAAELPVAKARIQGILGLLQHQSLPRRLKLLASALAPSIPKKSSNAVTKMALRFRKFEAHGDHWDEMTMPLVAPTLDALAGMCVLWDQTTCGMPAEHDNRCLLAATRVAWHTQELLTRMRARIPSPAPSSAAR